MDARPINTPTLTLSTPEHALQKPLTPERYITSDIPAPAPHNKWAVTAGSMLIGDSILLESDSDRRSFMNAARSLSLVVSSRKEDKGLGWRVWVLGYVNTPKHPCPCVSSISGSSGYLPAGYVGNAVTLEARREHIDSLADSTTLGGGDATRAKQSKTAPIKATKKLTSFRKKA